MAETSSFKLIIEDDEGRRSVVGIDLESEKDGISIGRQEGNIIRLNERNVSRRHARFVREPLGIYAEDLDSYNGVWVNGDRIKGRQELHDGDTVRVGDFQLELRGEGLQRRVEETTQRTMVGEGSEATRPDIRLEAKMNGGPLSPGLPPMNPPPIGHGVASAGASHAEGHGVGGRVDLPSRAPTIDEDSTGPEPTALVRVNTTNYDAVSHGDGAQVIAGQRAKIICVSTQFAGSEFEIDKNEVVIGRTDENEVAIDHRSVSRHHAKIVVNQRSYRIMDLKSANGTLVNGEEYAQTELKRGDLVELGHVKFRFVPPGATYELTQDELQAIRAVNPNARRGTEVIRSNGRGVPTVDSDVQNINMAPTAINQWSDELASIQRRRRMKPLVVTAGVALVVVVTGAGVIYKVMGRNERSSLPNAVVVSTPQNGEPQSGNPQVNDMMTRATTALAQKQWGEARKLSEAVLVLQPNYPQALEVQRRATDEMLGKAAVDKAREAIEAHRWDEAWRHLGEAPDGTEAAAYVPALRAQLRAGQVALKAEEARAKIAAGDSARAKQIIAELQEIDPSSPEIQALRNELDTGATPHSAPVAAVQPTPPPETAKADKTSKRNEPAKPSAKDTKPAAPAAPAPAPTPAPQPKTPPAAVAQAPAAPAAPPADARTYYSQGLQALQQQDTEKAIDLLDKCVKADTKAGMCYRALGISYARLKNGPKAAKYYRMYLRVQPDAKDAAQVEQLLKQYENSQ